MESKYNKDDNLNYYRHRHRHRHVYSVATDYIEISYQNLLTNITHH